MSRHNLCNIADWLSGCSALWVFGLCIAVAVAPCELFLAVDDQLPVLPVPEAKRGLSRAIWWWQGHLLPLSRRILWKLFWRMKWVGRRTCQRLPQLKRLKRLRPWWCTPMTSACRSLSPWRPTWRSSSPTFVCSTRTSFCGMLATWPLPQTGWRKSTTRSRISPGRLLASTFFWAHFTAAAPRAPALWRKSRVVSGHWERFFFWRICLISMLCLDRFWGKKLFWLPP